MKISFVRGFVMLTALLFAVSASVTYTACGNTPPPVEGGTNEATTTDGGENTNTTNNNNTTTTNNNNNTATNNNNTTTTDGGTEAVPEDGPEGTVSDTDPNCPPGCSNCTQPDPNNIQLGESCEVKTDKSDVCDKSKGLICAPFGVSNDIVSGSCLNKCTTDDECGKIRIGLKCLEFKAGDVTVKACGLRNKAGDPCNTNEQVYCATGNVCLISGADGSGTCILECTSTAECPKGEVCRQAVASSTRTFCLEPVLAGPKCIGDDCDVTNRSTNCLDGLTCYEGVCVLGCNKTNGNKDCDETRGEECYKQLFSSVPAFCRAKPTQTKAGDECNTTNKLCDDTKGLACLSEVCVQRCDANKGEDNNPDCASIAGAKCKQAQLQSGTINVCQIESKVNEPCTPDRFCTQGARCINLTGGPGPTCYLDCDPCTQKKNSSGTWVHDACGGTAGCTALTYSDGRPAGGICISSGDPVLDVNQVCGQDPKKGCKENLICVRFSNSPNGSVCSKQCDPNKGEAKNPDCNDGQCGRLTNGGGVCFPQGKKEIKEGDFCGDDLTKSCLEGLRCVTFSSAEDAKGLCSKQCDPQGDASECPSGECGRLTDGSGVCMPQLKRSRKSGETCRGPLGTPYADDCLEKDGATKLVCAPEGDTSDIRYCMAACDPANGLLNNSDCTGAGLSNHICLPDKTRPDLGACVEKCTFTNRLRCETSKCQYGVCQVKQLDSQKGQCSTAEDEKKCQDRGGKCEDKTCIANVCL